MTGIEQKYIDKIMIQLKNALSEGDWDGLLRCWNRCALPTRQVSLTTCMQWSRTSFYPA